MDQWKISNSTSYMNKKQLDLANTRTLIALRFNVKHVACLRAVSNSQKESVILMCEFSYYNVDPVDMTR